MDTLPGHRSLRSSLITYFETEGTRIWDTAREYWTDMAEDSRGTLESTDTAHRVLSDHERRQIVRILDESDGGTTVKELGTRLLDSTGESTDGEAIAIALHHRHLPMMADAGVIEYDGGDRVSLTPYGRTLATLRRVTDDVVDDRRLVHERS